MIHIRLLSYNNDDLERDLSKKKDHKCLLCTSGKKQKETIIEDLRYETSPLAEEES